MPPVSHAPEMSYQDQPSDQFASIDRELAELQERQAARERFLRRQQFLHGEGYMKLFSEEMDTAADAYVHDTYGPLQQEAAVQATVEPVQQDFESVQTKSRWQRAKEIYRKARDLPYALGAWATNTAFGVKQAIAERQESNRRKWAGVAAMGAVAVVGAHYASKSGHSPNDMPGSGGEPVLGMAFMDRWRAYRARRATAVETGHAYQRRRRVATLIGVVAVGWLASKVGLFDIDMGKNTDGGFFELNIPSGGDENSIDTFEGQYNDNKDVIDEDALNKRLDELGNDIEKGADELGNEIDEGAEDATEEVEPGSDKQDPEETASPESTTEDEVEDATEEVEPGPDTQDPEETATPEGSAGGGADTTGEDKSDENPGKEEDTGGTPADEPSGTDKDESVAGGGQEPAEESGRSEQESEAIQGAGRNFYVEYGNGITHEIMDYADARNNPVSPQQAYEIYQQLHAEHGRNIINLLGSGPDTYLAGSDVRLSHPGTARWYPDAAVDLRRYIRQS